MNVCCFADMTAQSYASDAANIVRKQLRWQCGGNMPKQDVVHVQPNCFVQPVLSEHGDREMPSICFFAMRNIPLMEELAYDYGASYIQTRLGGQCHCGDAVCTFAGSPPPST